MLCRTIPIIPNTPMVEYRKFYLCSDLKKGVDLKEIPHDIVPPYITFICTVSRYYSSPQDIFNRVMWFEAYVRGEKYAFRSSPEYPVFEIKITNFDDDVFDKYIVGAALQNLLHDLGSSLIHNKGGNSASASDYVVKLIRSAYPFANTNIYSSTEIKKIDIKAYRTDKYPVIFERFIQLPNKYYDDIWDEYDRLNDEKALQAINLVPSLLVAPVECVEELAGTFKVPAPVIKDEFVPVQVTNTEPIWQPIPAPVIENTHLALLLTNDKVSLSDRWGTAAPIPNKKRESQTYYKPKKW